jgi:hypothetical protein
VSGRAWRPLLALAALSAACGAGIPAEGGSSGGRKSRAASDSQAALFPETRAGWKHVDRATRARIDELARDYAAFLGHAKTPRRAVAALVDRFRAAGATPLGDSLAAGQRAFFIAPGGDAALLVIGGRGGAPAGVRAVVAAVDGPRIDLKQVPLYQHDTAAFLDTALYGTFPLESWLARPLALYIRLARGSKRGVDFAIGEAPGDPVLAIPDVPIHLARKVQAKENPVAEPERMDAYAGVSAAAVAKALRVHGLTDADLVEAEAYLVPAGPAALVGVDRAMVAGYAQTRLALAYLATRALGDAAGDQVTLAVILVSKSQVEGAGATGVGFVGRALSRALSAQSGGDLDVLASRRAHARSALLVAATGTGESNAGIIVSPTSDDALPGALRRALDRFARARVPTQIGEAKGNEAAELGGLDLDAVAVSLPIRSPGAPLELCSALDLHYGLVGLASWFAP